MVLNKATRRSTQSADAYSSGTSEVRVLSVVDGAHVPDAFSAGSGDLSLPTAFEKAARLRAGAAVKKAAERLRTASANIGSM